MQVTSDDYVNLIPPQHKHLPIFPQVVGALTEGPAQLSAFLDTWPSRFDLATALGHQLDVLGEWIGISRILTVQLTGIYFSWDETTELGWEYGYWQGMFDPETGVSSLGDEDYRQLLYTMIMLNHWDGSFEQLRLVWARFFSITDDFVRYVDEEDYIWDDDGFWIETSGHMPLFLDNQDMSITVGYVGLNMTDWRGEFARYGAKLIKPAAVRINDFMTAAGEGSDLIFAWDVDNENFSGWGTGSWPVLSSL